MEASLRIQLARSSRRGATTVRPAKDPWETVKKPTAPIKSVFISAASLPSAKSILLLEERSDAGNFHTAALSERGYRVSLTHSGTDAYQLWNECRPDLVLLSFRQFDQRLLDFLETIQSAIPTQLVAFLQNETLSLAPVYHDDRLVRMAECPEDYLKKIDRLLAEKEDGHVTT